jgi:hypothetical protein
VVGVTGVLLVVSLVLALRPTETAAESGVAGRVVASPCRSVEQVGDPPCPGYFGEIRVLTADGSLVTTAHTDRTGNYRVELRPGAYVIDPNDGGKSLANGDGRVTVREGAFSRVDLTHSTGMLCSLGRTWLHQAATP